MMNFENSDHSRGRNELRELVLAVILLLLLLVTIL